MTNLESLRSLQKRIREAKGADRALDWEIGFHVGGIGAEKERRLFAEMGPRCFTEKDKHGITPYGEARGDFVRPAKRGSREPFEHFTACDGPSPLMMCPRYTLDPDGLGPCVALMREVLPGWSLCLTVGLSGDYAVIHEFAPPCRRLPSEPFSFRSYNICPICKDEWFAQHLTELENENPDAGKMVPASNITQSKEG